MLNISNVSLETTAKLSTYNVVVQLKYLTDGLEKLNLYYGVHSGAVI
jgi:hypothetical protein